MHKLIFLKKYYPFIDSIASKFPCDSCHFAKQKKLSFNLSTTKIKDCFDLVHMDIWGPISVPSNEGHRYFLTVVDGKSKFTWIFFYENQI